LEVGALRSWNHQSQSQAETEKIRGFESQRINAVAAQIEIQTEILVGSFYVIFTLRPNYIQAFLQIWYIKQTSGHGLCPTPFHKPTETIQILLQLAWQNHGQSRPNLLDQKKN
jgi:hypothetical protein